VSGNRNEVFLLWLVYQIVFQDLVGHEHCLFLKDREVDYGDQREPGNIVSLESLFKIENRKDGEKSKANDFLDCLHLAG
jgi:hypothetical protein